MYRFLCSLLAVAPLMAGVTVLSDGDFQLANWGAVSFDQTNATGTNSRQATGGNPDAFRQMSVAIPFSPANTQVSVNIASFGLLLNYDPSLSGAIQQIQFEYDISRVGDTNLDDSISTGGYRPFLAQGGTRFFLTGVNDAASTSPWTAFSHISTNPNDWTQVNNGIEKPDFSATGAPIRFGYRVAFTGLCPPQLTNGCAAATALSGIDNFRITVTSADPTGNVPEPSTFALVTAAALAAVLRRR